MKSHAEPVEVRAVLFDGALGYPWVRAGKVGGVRVWVTAIPAVPADANSEEKPS